MIAAAAGIRRPQEAEMVLVAHRFPPNRSNPRRTAPTKTRAVNSHLIYPEVYACNLPLSRDFQLPLYADFKEVISKFGIFLPTALNRFTYGLTRPRYFWHSVLSANRVVCGCGPVNGNHQRSGRKGGRFRRHRLVRPERFAQGAPGNRTARPVGGQGTRAICRTLPREVWRWAEAPSLD